MTNDELPEVDEARVRISAQDKVDIQSFMEMCNWDLRRDCFSELDGIPGFRPRMEEEVKRQTTLVAKQIAGETLGNDKYWDAFFSVWPLVVCEKLSLPADEYQRLTEPAIRLTVAAELIEITLRTAADLKLSREEVSRLLLFSPSGDIDTYAARVNALTSRDDLEAAQRLEQVLSGLLELKACVDRLERDVRNETKQHDVGTKRLKELEEGFDALRATVIASSHSTKSEWDSLSEQGRETRAAVGQVERQILARLSAMERCVEENKRLARHAVDELMNVLASETDGQNARIETLQAAFDQLVADMPKSRGEDAAAKPPPSPIRKQNGVERTFPYVVARTHRTAEFAEECALRSSAQVIDRLKKNFEAVGLATNSAARAAAEVTAAIVARQWLVIYGQLSQLVVTAMLDGLGSAWNVRADVPIGLVMPRSVRIADTEAAQGARPVLLLDGANRSPLDLYSEELQYCALRAQMCDATDAQLDVSPFVIAHLVSSPAGLPVDSQFLSLGPCIDVDAYTWRMTGLRKPDYGAGQLHALERPVTKTVGFALLKQYQLAAADANELWRCSLRNFIDVLDVLIAADPRQNKEESVLQSMLACWVAPLIASKSSNVEDRREMFSGWDVQTNQFDADRRLAALLRTNLPGAEI